MSDAPRDTDELRQQRAQLDHDILALLLRRARLSRDAARAGVVAKLPSTERDTIEALVGQAGEELPAEAVRSIFRAIHAACRALEAPVRVVHAGGEGGEGGEAAARRAFGALATVARADSAAAALEAVNRQTADFAVLPYESTTEGMLASTLQALRFSEARLIALVDAEPGATLRHAVAALRPASRTGRDITALLFTASDEPGALFETLKHFAERGINLRKIQSRPAEGEGYLFFVELSGHITDRSLVSALEGIKKQTRTLKILGSFPA